MINKTQAYILLTTLIIIFSISVLVLAGATEALLMRKVNLNLLQDHLGFLGAEAGLVEAEHNLYKQAGMKCLYLKPLELDLAQQSIGWWRQQCQLQFPYGQVYYAIEILQEKPCVQKKHALHAYSLFRISSYSRSIPTGIVNRLQTIYALPKMTNCTRPTQRSLTTGRLSWRQLD